MTTIQSMRRWAREIGSALDVLFIGEKEIDYISDLCPIDEVRRRIDALVIRHNLKSVRADNGDRGYWIRKAWF
jgi:hypothetical protein